MEKLDNCASAPRLAYEEIGRQAKAPAPQKRKPLRAKVGQTLPSVDPAVP
jgi:hypothetical protein